MIRGFAVFDLVIAAIFFVALVSIISLLVIFLPEAWFSILFLETIVVVFSFLFINIRILGKQPKRNRVFVNLFCYLMLCLLLFIILLQPKITILAERLTIAGIGVVALLGGYFFWRFWQERRHTENDMPSLKSLIIAIVPFVLAIAACTFIRRFLSLSPKIEQMLLWFTIFLFGWGLLLVGQCYILPLHPLHKRQRPLMNVILCLIALLLLAETLSQPGVGPTLAKLAMTAIFAFTSMAGYFSWCFWQDGRQRTKR